MIRPTLGDLWRHSKVWWLVCLTLLLIGVGFLVVGVKDPDHPLVSPDLSRAVPKASVPVTTTPGEPVVARSTPVTVSVPAIGLTLPVTMLGLNLDGTVQVPTDIQEAGWYDLGPSPGQIGSAVVLGHVDSYKGPAAFSQLRNVVTGDQVTVMLTDGVSALFQVTSVAIYPKMDFPAQQVYGSHGNAALQLITCGGDFDTQTGSYESNVVVYSSLVSTTPAPV
jgi:LPXTG-site transpeptidase (sortase) family protein